MKRADREGEYEKKNWLKTGVLWGIGAVLMGCATTKETQSLNTDVVRLELQLYSIQKEKDAIKEESTAFQKETRMNLSTLEKELASFQKESRMSLSGLQRELDRQRTDYGLQSKNLQTDLTVRIETLQSQLNRVQREKDAFRNEFLAFQKEMQNEMAAMKKEEQALKQDLAAENKRSWAEASLRLDALQSEVRTLASGAEEQRQLPMKTSREVDLLKEDVAARMKGFEKRFEENSRTHEDRARAVEERFKGIENQYRDLDGKVGALPLKQGGGEKPLSEKETHSETKASLTLASNIYMDAYETLQKGDAEKARDKFETFLKDYPDIELSDNAQFWIGETYYQKRDFEKAILEYEKVFARYPGGDKVPAALYKQALAFLELGDRTNAGNLLKRLIERYPRYDQIEAAKKKLATIP